MSIHEDLMNDSAELIEEIREAVRQSKRARGVHNDALAANVVRARRRADERLAQARRDGIEDSWYEEEQ